uniref:Uncharacterized protein n=1 Tax=Anguilla anguilla TaxID=7936 RepID=A0A0E9W7Z7_ANGAN
MGYSVKTNRRGQKQIWSPYRSAQVHARVHAAFHPTEMAPFAREGETDLLSDSGEMTKHFFGGDAI